MVGATYFLTIYLFEKFPVVIELKKLITFWGLQVYPTPPISSPAQPVSPCLVLILFPAVCFVF